LKEHLYREKSLTLWTCDALDATSKADETEEQFRARLAPLLEAKSKAEREKLEKAHATKLAGVEGKIAKAQANVSTQRWQFFAKIATMAWVIVDTVTSMFGKGLPGRRRSLDPAFRSAATERGQHSNASLSLETAIKDKERLEQQHQEALSEIDRKFAPGNVQLESLELKPHKTDIEIDSVSLAWMPWRIGPDGGAQPVY
jgi:hypothetical protein